MSDTNAPGGTAAPVPEPIRFFGTRWVVHDAGYWLRRVAVGLGSLVTACVGAVVLRIGVEGVFIAKSGALVNTLLVLAVAVCTLVAAVRTWNLLTRGRSALTGWMADDKSVLPMLAIGFVGSLAVYFLRSLVEAPGEAEKRARYELALAKAARRRTPAGAGGRRRRR